LWYFTSGELTQSKTSTSQKTTRSLTTQKVLSVPQRKLRTLFLSLHFLKAKTWKVFINQKQKTMSSQSETGHAKNVANLLKYNQFLVTLGAAYNPPMATINLAALNALYLAARARLEAVNQAQDLWKTDTNNREIAFRTLNTFSTRLLGVLRSTNAPQQTVKDLSALVGKVRGDVKKSATQKAAAKTQVNTTDPVPEQVTTRSGSQQSFDLRLENFSKIILLLQGVAGYTPNEPELAIAGLQAYYARLLDLNTKATTAEANLRAARNERNTFFYAPETGVLDLIKKSKAYILGLYGRASQQNKTAVSYKFSQVLR